MSADGRLAADDCRLAGSGRRSEGAAHVAKLVRQRSVTKPSSRRNTGTPGDRITQSLDSSGAPWRCAAYMGSLERAEESARAAERLLLRTRAREDATAGHDPAGEVERERPKAGIAQASRGAERRPVGDQDVGLGDALAGWRRQGSVRREAHLRGGRVLDVGPPVDGPAIGPRVPALANRPERGLPELARPLSWDAQLAAAKRGAVVAVDDRGIFAAP